MAGVAGRAGRKKKQRKITTLSQRLLLVLEQERFTVRDLAVFLQPLAAYETLYGWIYRNHEPSPERMTQVEARLSLLEWWGTAQRERKRAIIPSGLKQYERGPHVKQSLADALAARRAASR